MLARCHPLTAFGDGLATATSSQRTLVSFVQHEVRNPR